MGVSPSMETIKMLPSYSVSISVFVFVRKAGKPSTNIMTFPSFAVKKGDVYSAKVLKALENIDDECDENGIIFIKVGFHF